MIHGSAENFAIESGITEAYPELGSRALGYFVLHIGGERYGVLAPDASLLACSLGTVEGTTLHRGGHLAPFFRGYEGGAIADAFRDAVYAPDQEETRFFGMSRTEFVDRVYSNHLVWAPDGDEAFDDGSYVLRIDDGAQVRLIGFRSGDAFHHDPESLRDLTISADNYYAVLSGWRDAFLAEWRARVAEIRPQNALPG